MVVIRYRRFRTTYGVPSSRVKILGPSRRKPEMARVFVLFNFLISGVLNVCVDIAEHTPSNDRMISE